MSLDRAAQHFGLFLTSLRNDGISVELSDASAGLLLADALDIVEPDDRIAADTAEAIANALRFMVGVDQIGAHNGHNPD